MSVLKLLQKNKNLLNIEYMFNVMSDIFPEELIEMDFENHLVEKITDDEIVLIVGNDWEKGYEVTLSVDEDGNLKYISHKLVWKK